MHTDCVLGLRVKVLATERPRALPALDLDLGLQKVSAASRPLGSPQGSLVGSLGITETLTRPARRPHSEKKKEPNPNFLVRISQGELKGTN